MWYTLPLRELDFEGALSVVRVVNLATMSDGTGIPAATEMQNTNLSISTVCPMNATSNTKSQWQTFPS